MNDLTELDHLEYFLNQAVTAAMRGRPEVDLWVNDALAIIDHLKSEL